MSLSIVVSHLESMDPELHRTCPMVLSHVRRRRSCIPLYNAIASQGDDRQTSVGVASRRPDAKIVIRNVGPLLPRYTYARSSLGLLDACGSHSCNGPIWLALILSEL
jgi:hypothetical protein